MNINSIPKIFTQPPSDATKFHPRDYPNTGNPLFFLPLPSLTSILRYDPHISPHIFALPKIRRLPKFLFFPSSPPLHSISRNFKARRDNPTVRSLLIVRPFFFSTVFKPVQRWAKVRISAENANFPPLPCIPGKNFIVGIFSKNSRSSPKPSFL